MFLTYLEKINRTIRRHIVLIISAALIMAAVVVVSMAISPDISNTTIIEVSELPITVPTVTEVSSNTPMPNVRTSPAVVTEITSHPIFGDLLGEYTLMAYCPCDICTNGDEYQTTSDSAPIYKHTIACNTLPQGVF